MKQFFIVLFAVGMFVFAKSCCQPEKQTGMEAIHEKQTAVDNIGTVDK